MREFLKVIMVLVIMAALLAAALAWISERPDQRTLMFRFGSPIVAILALVVFLRIHFRRDEVPDYLRQMCGGYFDRGGFCFSFAAYDVDGICFLDAFFQNKYERPCVGRIALRPAKDFFGRRKIDAITYEISCEAAAFGVARVPLPLPLAVQGKRQKFEVGASVHYPEGKGRMLRFRDGAVIRTNSNFGNSFGTALQVAGAMGGTLVLTRPASATVSLPIGVAEEIPDGIEPEVKTFWRLGDPPLEVSDVHG